ncbi:DUF2306 domain-containing protein [Pseudooctadecabacter jejudonensis]|uniref:DUF2306 domain-containing protein n=1 Tax=Pseudooctadecabacter jejudonensis TaxID=1391910 RepID=A0A1Y5SEF9_9RHOB|nr:DUF2306 domain-containing protein [Pseudooctadecabacter jejudonensis]SLN38863.1 hypothetical protein PSJ8397_01924 [Pseudooctadecabacter jejudonensis]
MSLDPILSSAPIVQLHVLFACLALLSGPIAMFRRKRDRLHKIAGYVGVVGMLGLALTGLGIKSNIAVLAHFGPIHVFSILATWGMAEAIWAIRIGDIARHRRSMQSTWFGALGVAGLFTLLPGRTLNRALFGEPSAAGYVVIAMGLLGLWALWRMQRDRTLP